MTQYNSEGINPAPNGISSIADSTLFPTNTPIGVGIYVISRGRIYWSVPVGKGDIAGTGNDWKSDPSTSSPAFRTQAAWFISNAGSDDNSGSVIGSPLATVAELQSRWGIDPLINQAVTITFLNDNNGGYLHWVRGNVNAVVEIIGATTIAASDTVSAYTDVSDTNNKWAQLTGTAIVDFTSYVGQLIQYTSGAASGAVAFILLQNPQGAGNGVAEVNRPFTEPSLANNYSPSAPLPIGGNTFNILTLSTINQLIIEVSDAGGNTEVGAAATLRPAFVLKKCNVPLLGTKVNGTGSRQRQFWGSSWNNWSDSTAANRNSTVQGCLAIMTQSIITPANYQGHAFKGVANVSGLFSYDDMSWTNVIFEGVSCSVQSGNIGPASAGFFNSNAVGLVITDGCLYAANTHLLGQGNATFGLQVAKNGAVSLSVASGITPKLTGTSGDWRFNNTATAYTWAQAPRASNSAGGTDTLGAGGTKAVPAPNLPADAIITVTCKTPAGAGAPGVYSVPSANRTSGAFTVNSTIATETSTFDWLWFSPSGGNGGIFDG